MSCRSDFPNPPVPSVPSVHPVHPDYPLRHLRPDCPCPPIVSERPLPCPVRTYKCPVVCKNSIPAATQSMDMFSTNTNLVVCIITEILNILADPGQLCNDCDTTTKVVCVDRCTIPFTGQIVTTITINLETTCGLNPITIQVFEKCNTWWFKIPNILYYDPTYGNDYPSTIGSVSVTKNVECPETWTGRILIDDGEKFTMCFPINFKLSKRSELIVKCDCPPFIETFVDYLVETPFEKMMTSGQIYCLSEATAVVLAGANIQAFCTNILDAFVISQQPKVQSNCGCGICAIGNDCNRASNACGNVPCFQPCTPPYPI